MKNIIHKTKMLLFCLNHLLRNYPTDKKLTQLTYKCIWLIENCPDVKVHISYYDINIRTSTNNISLWNANKYHAWLSSGVVNGVEWSSVLPSRFATYDFIKCLESKGYNVHETEFDKLNVDKIGC